MESDGKLYVYMAVVHPGTESEALAGLYITWNYLVYDVSQIHPSIRGEIEVRKYRVDCPNRVYEVVPIEDIENAQTFRKFALFI